MEEISLHLMDIIENSFTAGANLIYIGIEEYLFTDLIRITITDNGCGMDAQFLSHVTDPFVTTRNTRRVGLGLSLLQANARDWGGDLAVESYFSQGTTVRVWFQLSHIDRPPFGNWASTLFGLIMTRRQVDFIYQHRVSGDEFDLDTRELIKNLGSGALADSAVISFLRKRTDEALIKMGSDQTRLLKI